jgi:DNA-binding beta-propeller fold protein YncE
MSRKRILSAAACFAAHITLATLAGAQPPVVNNLQLAVNKTYLANQITSFPTGNGPSALAFDGEHMWVANSVDGTVMKLDTSTGQVLGTYPAGKTPMALAFDGANIWVASAGDGLLYKLRASDGTSVLTVPFASPNNDNQVALVFDGTNIWAFSLQDRNLTKVRAADGMIQGSFREGANAAMAFDGQYIWLAQGSGFHRIRASDGTDAGEVNLGCSIVSAAFDGTYVSGGCELWDQIFLVRASNLFVSKVFAGPNSNAVLPYAATVFSNGSYVWAGLVTPSTINAPPSVCLVRISDGAILGNFHVVAMPSAMAFDGAHVWVADYGNDTVLKL